MKRLWLKKALAAARWNRQSGDTLQFAVKVMVLREDALKKLGAEFIGTLTLVLFGCGAAVLAGPGVVGQLGIAFAFGLAIVAMAYGIGPVSGCHVNPAVSFGAFLSGRMSLNEMVQYWIAQFLGALAGAGLLYLIASGAPSFSMGPYALGANGWGAGYLGEYSIAAAFLFETVATFIFVVVILGSTQSKAPTQFAGLAIGLTLTVIHIVGIQVTGVSVNPARSFGPALLAQGTALSQLWLFIIAPLLGAGLAGLAFRHRLLSAD
jgi:aquaporin Z